MAKLSGMRYAFVWALGISLALVPCSPAVARVATLQVANLTNRCITVTVFAAADTSADMYQLSYQKPRILMPNQTAVLSAMKGRLAAMHVLVRTVISPSASCTTRYNSVAQSSFLSPRASLEVPLFKLVPVGAQFALLGPGT